MPKSKPGPIEEKDVAEFVAQASDFAFEMRILKFFSDRGFSCQHGGTYTDPITGKARQFDIRARRQDGSSEPHFVVESKNIRSESPLLVDVVGRRVEEAYHDLIRRDSGFSSVIHATHGVTAYQSHQPVGKQTSQVQRRADGSFVSSDYEVYEKLHQAVGGGQTVGFPVKDTVRS